MLEKRTLVDVKEAAKELNLSVATLKERRQLGKPPTFIKIGSRVFYDLNILREFINSGVRTSTKDKGSAHDQKQ